jgi:predicted esterase
MSLSVGLQLPVEKKLAGLLVMSGYLPAAGSFSLTQGLQDVPVMHCHGSADPMVRTQHDIARNCAVWFAD